MTPGEVVALAPFGLLLLGGLLCLLLEAAGTPPGGSKRGPRTHLAIVALLALGAGLAQHAVSFDAAGEAKRVLLGALVVDPLGQLASGLLLIVGALCVAAAVPALRELGAERGEAYALLLFVTGALMLLVLADDLLVVSGALLCAHIGLAALAALERATAQGAEAAAKAVVSSGLSLSLLGFGTAVIYGASGTTSLAGLGVALEAAPAAAGLGLALVAAAVLSWLPTVPLHMARVDVSEGASPFVGALGAAGGLVSGAVLAARIGEAVAPGGLGLADGPLVVGAGLSLTVPALVALDQRRVRRMVAHLAVVQAGGALSIVWLAARGEGALAGPALVLWMAATALATAGAVGGISFFERPGGEEGTWERYSGAGRRHPVFTVAFLWALASLAGLPGTAGFAARLEVADAVFGQGQTALGLALLASPALAAAPVLRLAIFLFAKAPDRGFEALPSGWRAVSLGLTATALAAVGVLSSSLLLAARGVTP